MSFRNAKKFCSYLLSVSAKENRLILIKFRQKRGGLLFCPAVYVYRAILRRRHRCRRLPPHHLLPAPAAPGWRILILTLPYLTFGAGAQGTPALRPQFGPNAQPRQTSRSNKSLRGFCKPQENCPVDTVKSVQWERVIIEDRSSEQHCSTALSNEVNWSFLLILAEGTYRFISETHNFEVSIKIGVTGK